MECTAHFEVWGEPLTANPIIKINNQTSLKFTFNKSFNGKASGTCSETFKSTNQPYLNAFDYIEKFELNFIYSIDGGQTWLDAGSSQNELYITWKKPNYANFSDHTNPKKTMQIALSGITQKKIYIPESLLYIGCKQGKKPMLQEVEVLDTIFEVFTNLNVKRRNETFGSGMGYWRGKSAIITQDPYFEGSPTIEGLRGLRWLLREGEARCGEFTTLFNAIAYVQGITLMKLVTIDMDTSAGTLSEQAIFFLVKNCKMEIQSKRKVNGSPYIYENFEESKAQGNNDAVNIFGDHVFSLHDASGRYYDASYGKKFSISESTFSNYCDKMLDGIFTINPKKGLLSSYIRHYNKILGPKFTSADTIASTVNVKGITLAHSSYLLFNKTNSNTI